MRTANKLPATRNPTNSSRSNHAGTDAAAHLAHELIDRAARHLQVSEENLRQRAADTSQVMRSSLLATRERGQQARDSTLTLFQRHPVAAVGLALGAGALLALLSRAGRGHFSGTPTSIGTPPAPSVPH